MSSETGLQIRMIPVNQINVLNPRSRGKKKFSDIVSSIETLGLKRPITVALSEPSDGKTTYDLACGQGRLEAYMALGALEIPAFVIDGTKEDLMLMSLAENIARRNHSTLELVREIGVLKERGYTISQIADKTALSTNYVRGILTLLQRGEERLLHAVQKGQMPLNIAITIATSDDKAVQNALTEAYDRNVLRGRALLRARSLIESRRARGKQLRTGPRKKLVPDSVSADSLLKTYQDETIRQRMTVQKARTCETRLLFACSALKHLLQDENFVNLLRAEGLDSVPQFVADQARVTEAAS